MLFGVDKWRGLEIWRVLVALGVVLVVQIGGGGGGAAAAVSFFFLICF